MNESGPRQGRRCLLVVNPQSRSGDERGDEVLAVIREGGWVLLGGGPIVADEIQDVIERYRLALDPVGDRILVGGGDGTINHLLPLLMQTGIPVGLVPLGTANDLARSLGLPESLADATRIALDGRVLRIDLGRVNGRLFANVASLGLGPKVTEQLSRDLKKRLGILGYPRALLSAYREMMPFRCRVTVDGARALRMRTIHVAVGNGRFYGGGAAVHEDAAIDDERLDLFALSPMPLWRLLLLGWRLKRGAHRELSEVRTLHGRRISIRTSRPLPISADGELLSETPADFEVLPRALPVVVPRGQEMPAIQGLRGSR